ncbi:MAG: metal-sensing transcriptional repressor [bacterium]
MGKYLFVKKTMHTNDKKKKQLIAFKKARSLLDKIVTMAEKDEYCIDIVQQNLAVIGLLKNINLQLLDGHLNCCFVDAVKANDKKRMNGMIDEILTIVKTAQNK